MNSRLTHAPPNSQEPTMTTTLTPKQLVDRAYEAILRTQFDGAPAVLVDSPPGAGKSRLVEYLSACCHNLRSERVLVVTRTNAQAKDLAARIGERLHTQEITLFLSSSIAPGHRVGALENVSVVSREDALPDGQCVVIANASKLSYLRAERSDFDVMICDEAYQLPEVLFSQIANLAARYVMVGDPGQLDPILDCDTTHWATDASGPQRSAPDALLARRGDQITRAQLPVSMRLPADSAPLVQRAFYPELEFTSWDPPGARGLTQRAATGHALTDALLSLTRRGVTLGHVRFGGEHVGSRDAQMASAIAETAAALVDGAIRVRDYDGTRALTPGDVGVVVAHRAQVQDVVSALGPRLSSALLVETADRFQGLERKVILAWHPLSGAAQLDTFHLDPGRLCVMLSRHRVACWVFGRPGIASMLASHSCDEPRVLGDRQHAEWRGLQAHRRVMSAIDHRDRCVPFG